MMREAPIPPQPRRPSGALLPTSRRIWPRTLVSLFLGSAFGAVSAADVWEPFPVATEEGVLEIVGAHAFDCAGVTELSSLSVGSAEAERSNVSLRFAESESFFWTDELQVRNANLSVEVTPPDNTAPMLFFGPTRLEGADLSFRHVGENSTAVEFSSDMVITGTNRLRLSGEGERAEGSTSPLVAYLSPSVFDENGSGTLRVDVGRGATLRLQAGETGLNMTSLQGTPEAVTRIAASEALLWVAEPLSVTESLRIAVGDAVSNGNLVFGDGAVLGFGGADDEGRITVASGAAVRFEPGSRLALSEGQLEELSDRLTVEDGADVSGLTNLDVTVGDLSGHFDLTDGGLVFVEGDPEVTGPMREVALAVWRGSKAESVGVPAFWKGYLAKSDVENLSYASSYWALMNAAMLTDSALLDAARRGEADALGIRSALRHADASLKERTQALRRERMRAAALEGRRPSGAALEGFWLEAMPNLPLRVDVESTVRWGEPSFDGTDPWRVRREETRAGLSLLGAKDRKGTDERLYFGLRLEAGTADVSTGKTARQRFEGESNTVSASLFGAWESGLGFWSADVAWAQASDSAERATAGTRIRSDDVESTLWSVGLRWTTPEWERTFGNADLRWTASVGGRLHYLDEVEGGVDAGTERILETKRAERLLGEFSLSLDGEASGHFGAAAPEWSLVTLPRAWRLTGGFSAYALAGDTKTEIDVSTAGTTPEYRATSRLRGETLPDAVGRAALGADLLWRDATFGLGASYARGNAGFEAATLSVRVGMLL